MIKQIFRKHNINILLLLIISSLVIIKFISSLYIMLHNDFATGYDGYFYVLQVKSLKETGHLLINDNSIAFKIMYFINFFVPDIVLSNKVTSAFFGSLSVIPFFLVARKISGKLFISFFVTMLFAFSFSYNYLSIEYIKNSMAVTFFLFFILFLLYSSNSLKHLIPSFIFFILTLLCHKLMAGLALVLLFSYVFFIINFNKSISTKYRVLFNLSILVLVIMFIFIIKFISLGVIRGIDLQNLFNSIRWNNLPDKFSLLKNSSLHKYEIIELIIYHIIPLLLLLDLIINYTIGKLFKLKLFSLDIFSDHNIENNYKIKSFIYSILVLSLIIINPFLKFDFDNISFRLLLMGFTSVPLLLMVLVLRFNQKILNGFSMAGIIFILIFCNPFIQRNILSANRYPDYEKYYESFNKIPDFISNDKKIIAHKGISSFIWTITGIEATHFQPGKNLDNYYRVVYGFCDIHFEDYTLSGSDSTPVELKWPYMLVSESLWQKYYSKNKGKIFLLDNWHNPSDKRPITAYYKKNN